MQHLKVILKLYFKSKQMLQLYNAALPNLNTSQSEIEFINPTSS